MMRDRQSTTITLQLPELSLGAKHSKTESMNPSKNWTPSEMELSKEKNIKMSTDFMTTF